MNEQEDTFNFKIDKPNIFVRLWMKFKIWYKMRQLTKDDPFIYENKDK